MSYVTSSISSIVTCHKLTGINMVLSLLQLKKHLFLPKSGKQDMLQPLNISVNEKWNEKQQLKALVMCN